MDEQTLTLTDRSREAVLDTMEILDRDFGYGMAPEYKKRNLMRALYRIAQAGGEDARYAVNEVIVAMGRVKTEATEKLVKEADPNA